MNCIETSGIYKLKCNTCNNSYAGQSGGSIGTRYKEYTQYIRTNNPISAYALYILINRHEYGPAEETLELLKPCNKGTRMNCWEALYMQDFHQRNILIEEQHVNVINSPYELAQHVTWPTTHSLTQSQSKQCKRHTPTRVKRKGKCHPCTGTEALYRPYGP